MDFLFLQEIKAIDFTLEVNLNVVLRDALNFFTKNEKGRGGAANLINSKWSESNICLGISPCNRVFWVTFKNGDSSFGICTMYDPNYYREISELWQWLFDLPDIPWIFWGDFNMIEHKEDKIGRSNVEWKGDEKIH